jgi:hypothetical protein
VGISTVMIGAGVGLLVYSHTKTFTVGENTCQLFFDSVILLSL